VRGQIIRSLEVATEVLVGMCKGNQRRCFEVTGHGLPSDTIYIGVTTNGVSRPDVVRLALTSQQWSEEDYGQPLPSPILSLVWNCTCAGKTTDFS